MPFLKTYYKAIDFLESIQQIEGFGKGKMNRSPGKNSSFNLYYFDIAQTLQRLLQFLMHCV